MLGESKHVLMKMYLIIVLIIFHIKFFNVVVQFTLEISIYNLEHSIILMRPC